MNEPIIANLIFQWGKFKEAFLKDDSCDVLKYFLRVDAIAGTIKGLQDDFMKKADG